MPKTKVQLMLTCLCDAFFGEVGIASVKVLEAVGCEVEFPTEQTCCGQPAYNSGHWDESRPVAEHAIKTFGLNSNSLITVVPSGSCAAMVREGYKLLFPNSTIDYKAYELGEFLWDHIGIRSWPPVGLELNPNEIKTRKIVYHRACHGRGIHIGDKVESLLRTIPGLELLEPEDPEQCCGFGGAFSATHGQISSDLGIEKWKKLFETGADELISGDMGCLMHLQTLKANKIGKIRHFAQLLAETVEQKHDGHSA